MKPDEKTENDLSPDSEGVGGAAGESAVVGLEQEEEKQPYAVPDAEERDGSDEESVPDPERERAKSTIRTSPDGSKLKSILEAMIFVSEQPISLDRLAGVLTDCPKQKLREILKELEEDYRQREGALEIVQVANGYQFRTRAELAPWLGRLRQQKFARLSRAALETLAIVAYRQPVTRAEAEAIRGVDSGAVLGTLLERRLIRILGRKEVPGRPILYGTTQEFLELFGLKNLKDLPTLREIKDMVEQSKAEPESPEGEGAEADEGAGEEGTGAVETEDRGAFEDDDEDEYEKGTEEEEVGSDYDDDWSRDEEPLGQEEITPRELDEILKSTRTRLELYETDVEDDQEEIGDKEPAGGEAGNKKAGEGENPGED